MADFVYSPANPENTNLMKFAKKHGISGISELYNRADADPDWFWPAVIEDVGISFFSQYAAVRDSSRGIPWTLWFPGGQINITYNCVERHKDSIDPAVKYETEGGRNGSVSYRELDRMTGKLAGFLRSSGISKGDRIGVYMPPSLEGVVALYAIMRMGAVAVPVFSGYGKEAVRTRMIDSGSRAMFSMRSYRRKGKIIDNSDVTSWIPGIIHIVKDGGNDGSLDFWSCVENGDYMPSERTSSEDPAIMLYTSGTTGKPKGTVHVHGGSFINITKEVKYYMDMGPGDTLFWISDLGWMMGPWSIIGSNALGGSIFVYDGAVDYPDENRLWDLVSKNGVTILGLSPTLVRSYRSKNISRPLSGIRVFGSTGEPWDDDSWMWLFRELGSGRVPIANISGGTDIIGCFLASTPAIPLKPRCLFRGLGMHTSVFDADGKEVTGKVGYLVSRDHCPSMTRGIWQQPEKYLETYWSTFPNTWVQGDWAEKDENGYYFLFGRSDDVIKTSGKRLGPNEVENVVMEAHGVVESAVVGIPDPVKGEAVAVFYTGEDTDQTRKSIMEAIKNGLGRSFSPKFIIWLPQLPKTRNGKIMRRVVKRAFIGEDPGDLSNIEDTAIVDYIREVGIIRDRPDGENGPGGD